MTMLRTCTALLFCCLLHAAAMGQAEREHLLASAKALPQARTAQQRDSLDAHIKSGLRALFDRDDFFTMDLTDLPLSRVDAPDGTFRLITWNLPDGNGGQRFEGFLMVQNGRKRSLFELRDRTPEVTAPEVPELGPDRWYGALYYTVIPVEKGGRTYYTLLGWKGYSSIETRKVIEVLSFRGGKPRFGAPLFGTGKLRPMRKVFGYSFQASMTLRYDAALEAIIMDHLSPSRADMKDQRAFYGPDMTHDAYFWHKGEWWLGEDIDLRDPRKSSRTFKAPPPSGRP